MIGFHGKCHCGAIEVVFETSIPLAELETRSCACSFCVRHGARTASDPNGRVTLHVKDASQLSRYRWGLATADFFVCRKCGVFVAAVLDDAFSTLNVNILELDSDTCGPLTCPIFSEMRAESSLRAELAAASAASGQPAKAARSKSAQSGWLVLNPAALKGRARE